MRRGLDGLAPLVQATLKHDRTAGISGNKDHGRGIRCRA
jgi:hypothetical protein